MAPQLQLLDPPLVAPTNYSSSQKTRLNDLSYGVKMWTDVLPFCHNARVGQTDRQTDRILIARTRLHSMQRGKNAYRSHRARASCYHGVVRETPEFISP